MDSAGRSAPCRMTLVGPSTNRVRLTDKYPNTAALARIAEEVPGVRFEAGSVSALDVPARLTGFRTMFTAFHHFRPADARGILASALRDREGIAIFEATSRT